MAPDQRAGEPIAHLVLTTTHTRLTSLQGRLAHGRDRHVPAQLIRSTPPDDPSLWLLLDLTGLHPAGADLAEHAYRRAATAVTAAAQLWARTDLTHQRTTAQRPTVLGQALASAVAARPGGEDDLARLLRAHTLPEALRYLLVLLHHAAPARLDFALLARDLYTWQTQDGPRRVGQLWVHAYTTAKARTTSTNNSATPTSS
ncbi:type I-E CRISPR-associated protein Cse2/CasB [Streptomyces sp. NPDC053474]|uniref:type I-E CRISPR-associated protein Cse2/CasB n=1 Tax=Streptomyces sp. NPDC053474 TaxID=3365704 RepID=UPI0037CF57B5